MTEIKPRIDEDGVKVSFVQDGPRLQVFIADVEWFANQEAADLIADLKRLLRRVIDSADMDIAYTKNGGRLALTCGASVIKDIRAIMDPTKGGGE